MVCTVLEPVELSQVQFLVKDVLMPLGVRQGLVQTCRKPAESPQVQFFDVGIPVVVLRQVAVQLSTPTGGCATDSFIDMVFDV